jgi:hypothetical protein
VTEQPALTYDEEASAMLYRHHALNEAMGAGLHLAAGNRAIGADRVRRVLGLWIEALIIERKIERVGARRVRR